MAKTALTAGGAQNNLTPMEVVVPLFGAVKNVGQSLPLVSASNTITATISASVDFPANSTIMLSGLAGTQTATVGDLPVGGADSSSFGDEGAWTDTGTLVLTVASGGLSAGTSYAVSFVVQNSDTARAVAVTVAVSASLDSGGEFDSPVDAVNLVNDPGDLLGVTNGASPLRTVEPTTRPMSGRFPAGVGEQHHHRHHLWIC
ncbi:hypothetical protein T484DRAFT_3536156 [Baffinella frigidus]|nr:hypothetical protein T484DRAFT_3536156 [Cryptophyta sp. CCMP2293]